MKTDDLKIIYKTIVDTEDKYLETNIKTIPGVDYAITRGAFNRTEGYYDLMAKNYLQASKQVNKLKRLDPNKKIIDASDIDWTEYKINFNGTNFIPQSTYELFNIIFSLFTDIYNGTSNLELVWNDRGLSRISRYDSLWNYIPSNYDPKQYNNDGVYDSTYKIEWNESRKIS